MPTPGSALPTLIIIGAMKCGTTALHDYLDLHPEITMSRPKELNFFLGQRPAAGEGGRLGRGADAGQTAWAGGNWHRGATWYAGHFDPATTIRGESSPGYTSPSHPEVASRMARMLPAARLIYLVRDPLERAVSQYRHHQRDGSEHRSAEQALFDPGSQYVSRSRYHERLAPFLRHYPRAQIAVVAQEELAADPEATLQGLFAFAGASDSSWSPRTTGPPLSRTEHVTPLSPKQRQRFCDAVSDDVERLRRLAGRAFPDWTV